MSPIGLCSIKLCPGENDKFSANLYLSFVANICIGIFSVATFTIFDFFIFHVIDALFFCFVNIFISTRIFIFLY